MSKAGKHLEIRANDGGVFTAYRALPASGSGPALVLLPAADEPDARVQALAEHYAEEGYVVLAPDLFRGQRPAARLGFAELVELHGRFDFGRGFADLAATVEAARAMPEVTGPAGEKKVGALGFGLGGTLACLAAVRSAVDCAAAYGPVRVESALAGEGRGGVPVVVHFGGRDESIPQASVDSLRALWSGRYETELYVYPAAGHDFTRQDSSGWHKPSESIAYSRSLAVLRRVLGPRYDLSALWDMHCYYEFATRDADATMTTMVADPYVNNVPIMTGGTGKADLRRFYADHFVNVNPKDMEILPLSRTIGADRLVDEFIARFTHDVEMDWMLPGLAPTGKRVEIPVTVVVHFRGDKLCGEQLYWDQASVLVQLGMLDPQGLPVSGAEATLKRADPSAVPSNTLMRHWADAPPKSGV
jgi:carboxymethylenebutenolidase